MRSAIVGAGSALWLSLAPGCGGAGGRAGDEGTLEPADRCVVALRFSEGFSEGFSERLVEEGSASTGERVTAEVELPTTEVSLVRICDREGRIVRGLGVQRGVCQRAEPAPGELLAARCWWPGVEGRLIRVARSEDRALAHGAREDAAGGRDGEIELLGEVDLPARARVAPLDPVGAR
jgi:hypothetical protein